MKEVLKQIEIIAKQQLEILAALNRMVAEMNKTAEAQKEILAGLNYLNGKNAEEGI